MTILASISYRAFKRFLESHGLKLKRKSGSHEMWNRDTNPFDRPVVIRSKDKNIPIIIIKSNLKTMGISIEQFLKESKNL